MDLLFATNNPNKLKEIRQILDAKYRVLSLADMGINESIPETQPTLEGNARQKSEFIYERTGVNCFSDDTGLEISSLDGRPGVYSARYAGPDCRAEDNMDKVLAEMKGVTDRKAKFRTVISLILEGKEYQFEGEVEGEILEERTGTTGFGYDPIFRPDGYDQSFAEMSMEEKNAISHRGRAIAKLTEWLLNLDS